MGIQFRHKYLLFLCCFVIATGSVKAQLNHYIYLQTDSHQVFYIKYNNRIYSSTTSGYIILAQLKEGPVSFQLGFPKSNLPEQKFECTIATNDKGYLIKNFNDKGWGLFDLQTSDIIYAKGNEAITPVVPENNNTAPSSNDPFANMLSKVTQDSTVKNVTVQKIEKPVVVDTPKTAPPPVVVSQPVTVKKDSVQAAPVPPPTVTPDSQVEWSAPQKSVIRKIKAYESTEGKDLVFEVMNEKGMLDTVRLFIAKEKEIIVPEPEKKESSETLLMKDTMPVQKAEIKAPVTPEVKQEPVTITEKPVEIKREPAIVPNSNCKAEASEDDFIKLRRKMASQSKDQSMVAEAVKVFKNKCFSTLQIRSLSALFISDEWRYRFYDAAMPFVTDFTNFKKLEDTISDDYYKKRFLALLPGQ